MEVKSLMCAQVGSVYQDRTVQDAAEEMARCNHGLLAVLDNPESKVLVGVISNKDIINKVIAKKLSSEKTPVSDIMTKNPICIEPEESTSKAMMLMKEHEIKRVIVTQEGRVQGIITSNDITYNVLKKKKELLDLAVDF